MQCIIVAGYITALNDAVRMDEVHILSPHAQPATSSASDDVTDARDLEQSSTLCCRSTVLSDSRHRLSLYLSIIQLVAGALSFSFGSVSLAMIDHVVFRYTIYFTDNGLFAGTAVRLGNFVQC